LTSVLLDLTQTGTIETSLSLGDKVLKELKQVGKLHKPRVERARFVVLQSLGIPSILVETGFITNRREERKLQSWRHQQAIANSILKGINSYFTDQSPPGTFFAQRDRKKDYVIKRGDTLSVIASNYNVTMDNIKRLNSLGSDSLKIGQILRIPN
jgi:N-acetylmuramoyl-L-alanine amidase